MARRVVLTLAASSLIRKLPWSARFSFRLYQRFPRDEHPCRGFAGAKVNPTKQMELVVPFVAGGATDNIARMMAQRFTESWGAACDRQ